MSDEKQKSQKAQIDRFREKARELECDESEDAFDSVVREIAKPPLDQAKEKKEP